MLGVGRYKVAAYMRKFLLIPIFFILTPGFIVFSMFLLLSRHSHGFLANVAKQQVAYAALPSNQNVLGASVATNDNRLESLQNFLATYHSPLYPYASLIISDADTYNIDYRLIPGIAMQETTLCKKTLPNAQYNCWGWGIWGKQVKNFNSYEDGIDTISRYFANRKEKGIVSLDAIGNIYNPGNTNHWKENVAKFMAEMYTP